MHKQNYYLLITLLISGCATTYTAPSLMPTAEIFVVSENKSESATSRVVSILAYNDEECNSNPSGTMVDQSMVFRENALTITAPKKIMANQKFVFTGRYGESRFAQNRECYITGAFTPEANHRYKAKINVANDVAKCDMELYDITSAQEQKVNYYVNKYVCFPAGKTKILSGTQVLTNWQFSVTTTQAK